MAEEANSSRPKRNTTVYNIKYNEDDIEVVHKNENEEADGDGDDDDASSEVYVVSSVEKPVKEVYEHVCGICERSFSSYYSLNKHMKTCVPKQSLIGESYEEFTIDEILELQKSINESEESNICFCCEENLETAHSGHIRCQDCPKSFKNVNSFRRHVSFLHSSSYSAKPCGTCNAKCPTLKILQLHSEAHKKGNKPFACLKCGKDFTRKYHLHRHLHYSKCDPSQQALPYKCNVCGKEFFRVDNLRTHLRQHIGGEPKTRDYVCPYCGKAFMGTTTLNIHIRVHTGERPFACDVCDRRFPSNSALRKHRRSHTGEKPFTCNECGRSFGAKEVLNRHMKTHSGIRPHVCQECGKSFIQATQLKNHMFIHTGEKNFVCEKCNYSFYNKKRLADHVDSFHDDDPNDFDCKPCDITFDEKDLLVEHMKTHENSKLFKCPACRKRFVNLHPNCPDCILCKKNRSKSFNHKHCLVDPAGVLIPKKIRMICIDSEAGSSQGTKKLKILTSKAIKTEDEVDNVKVTVKKRPATTKAKRTRKVKKLSESTESEGKEDRTDIISESVQDDKSELTIVKEEMILYEASMDDETLKDCVAKLLNLLLDQELLQGFGWPTASVEHVLSSVIKQCGNEPADYDTCADYSTKIRENVKLLFTVVLENESFKQLLNNHSIDEVIYQILEITK